MHMVRFFIVFVSVMITAPSQITAQGFSGDLAVYQALSRELSLSPIALLTEAGSPAFLSPSGEYELTYSSGPIVDLSGLPISLPAFLGVRRVPGRNGLYLIEHPVNRARVVRLGWAKEDRFIVGPYLENRHALGSLFPLPGGEVASLIGGVGNPVRIVFDAFRINNETLLAGNAGVSRTLAGKHTILGSMVHPVSGEPGAAFLSETGVEVIYSSGAVTTVSLQPGIRVFAVSRDELIAGFFNPQCPQTAGLPSGTCTPFLFQVPIPEGNTTLTVNQLTSLDPLHTSTPGWTFGALAPVQEPSDLRVVGDRLYVISYRGMNQSLGYFSLSEPGQRGVIIPGEEGTSLAFGTIASDEGEPALIIERTHLTQPFEYRLVTNDEATTIYTAPAISAVAETDLSLWAMASDATRLVSPAVIIGQRATVESRSCGSGTALVEVHGGSGIAMRPSSPAGLVPALFEDDGIHVIVSVPGSGGYGIEWTMLGAYENTHNQARSLSRTLQILRNTGCERIVLTGFSHGGVVSMNTALLYPQLVDAVVIGGAPMDPEADLEMGNQALSAFLPRGFDVNSSGLNALPPDYWSTISPSRNLASAQDLSGLSVTLFFGSADDRVSSFAPAEFIAGLEAKGAQVRVIERPGVGHTKWSNPQQWAEYYGILASAISGDP